MLKARKSRRLKGSQRHWRRCVWLALNTKPYDSADYLKDAESIFYFLEAEVEENEMPYLASALGTVIRARGGVDVIAAETGLSVDVLEFATRTEGNGDHETVVKVMEAYRRRMSSDSKVA